jgi:hypothetical protein
VKSAGLDTAFCRSENKKPLKENAFYFRRSGVLKTAAGNIFVSGYFFVVKRICKKGTGCPPGSCQVMVINGFSGKYDCI